MTAPDLEEKLEARRRLFQLHKDHGWSIVDGSAWCDSCLMSIDHPTPIERDESSVDTWGPDWTQRSGLAAGPYRQTELERLRWHLDVVRLELHRVRLEYCAVAGAPRVARREHVTQWLHLENPPRPPAPAAVECQDCGAGVGEYCVAPRRNWWFMWHEFTSATWVCPVRRLQALKAFALK